jgi:hypothetical protein
MLLGSITSFIDAHSQWALLTMFGLLLLESFGLPVPGETALIACSGSRAYAHRLRAHARAYAREGDWGPPGREIGRRAVRSGRRTHLHSVPRTPA